MINEATMTGFDYIGQPLATENLEFSLTQFLDWGYLNKGGYYNIYLNTSGNSSEIYSKLRLSEDARYTKGRVWESFRKNWVWESGVEVTPSPINISGIYINNTFYSSSTTGQYSHKIDYVNGRVIFDNPISITSTVKCEYSFKKINVHNSKTPLLKYLQLESLRKDKGGFELYGSGNWALFPEQRLQLPCIVVQAVPGVVNHSAYEVGNYSTNKIQEVLFHVVSEDSSETNFIHDTIVLQHPRNLFAIDKGEMIQDSAFPLNYAGNIIDKTKIYPELIKHKDQGGYRWKQITFVDINSIGANVVDLSRFYSKTLLSDYTVVRGYFEILLP